MIEPEQDEFLAATAAVREGKLGEKSDAELLQMSRVLRFYQERKGNPVLHVIEAVENERLRRRLDESITETRSLKSGLQRLEKPRHFDWWLLAVAIVTAIFAGIAALDVIFKWNGK